MLMKLSRRLKEVNRLSVSGFRAGGMIKERFRTVSGFVLGVVWDVEQLCDVVADREVVIPSVREAQVPNSLGFDTLPRNFGGAK